MHWQSFFKGIVFSVFFLLFSLTTGTLGLEVRQELALGQKAKTETEPVYLATRFPAVLGTQITKPGFHDFSVLLLGLDSRKGDKSARCDAIHTVSFLPSEGKIQITSVPRGAISKDGNIIANVCSIYGFEVAKAEIEKITGIPADYVVKTGFSQAMGALRLLGLPPSPTLQFLRDRKDFLIGDNQRSYNQAVFLKDILSGRMDQINALPEPAKYLGFKLLDTNLDYDTAMELFEEIIASGLYKNPDNIEIAVRPKDNWVREEIHLGEPDWAYNKDPEYVAYQKELVSYLEDLVKSKNLAVIKTVAAQKLWLQLDDAALRTEYEQEITDIININGH